LLKVNPLGAKMKKSQAKTHIPRYISEDENFWRQHISTFLTSGVTRTVYCQNNGINYHRFSYWIKKLSVDTLQVAKCNQQVASQHAPLLPVQLKPQALQSDVVVLCTLNLKNGSVLHIHHERVLSILLERWA
jgi:hypothetical protein